MIVGLGSDCLLTCWGVGDRLGLAVGNQSMRATEMTEHPVRLAVEPIEVAEGVLVEREDVVSMMVVGDRETESRPEPFRGVRLGIVWRRVDEPQALAVTFEGCSESLRALPRMDAEVVEKHDHLATPSRRAFDQMIELETEDLGVSREPVADREKAVAPVEGAEADEASARAWRTDQALTAAAFPTPDLMERRMEPNVDLVLDVEVGGGEQPEKLRDVGGDFRPEVVIDEVMPVEVSKGGGLRRRLRNRCWGRWGCWDG